MLGRDHSKLLDAAVACCDAELPRSGQPAVGDSTELALLLAGAEQGIQREDVERTRPRLSENPFDSIRKRMSVLRADGTRYVKGAVEAVLSGCTVGVEGALAANESMAKRGLRVLAVATGQGPDEDKDLTLLGLVGLADPPRAEVREAVAQARAAGIETVMMTGDHLATAQAIAGELGIERVHARLTPAQKLTLVRELKQKGGRGGDDG